VLKIHVRRVLYISLKFINQFLDQSMQKIIKLFVLVSLFPWIGLVNAEVLLAQINLDDAAKKVTQDKSRKLLGAKTETVSGKKVHVIKVLTPDGRIQHYKVDAESGKLLKNPE